MKESLEKLNLMILNDIIDVSDFYIVRLGKFIEIQGRFSRRLMEKLIEKKWCNVEWSPETGYIYLEKKEIEDVLIILT